MLETFRECLRDVLDLPALVELLTRLQRREISLVEVETATASPFASSLLFDYVATYMYEGDTPNAERRAAALSLDRDLLRELLGQEELRDLIDPAALAERRGRPAVALATSGASRTRDGLHDMLRTSATSARPRWRRASSTASTRPRCCPTLRAGAARVQVRVGGEERWIDAVDAGLYRDALGVAPPGGLPERVPRTTCPTRCSRVVRRYAATHGPFTRRSCASATGVDPARC